MPTNKVNSLELAQTRSNSSKLAPTRPNLLKLALTRPNSAVEYVFFHSFLSSFVAAPALHEFVEKLTIP